DLRRGGGHDRRDRELRARRPGVPRLRGLDRADGPAVWPAGARLRLPLLRHPRMPQLRLRAGRSGGGGPDPRDRAAIGTRGDAPTPWARESAGPLLRARKADAGPRDPTGAQPAVADRAA